MNAMDSRATRMEMVVLDLELVILSNLDRK